MVEQTLRRKKKTTKKTKNIPTIMLPTGCEKFFLGVQREEELRKEDERKKLSEERQRFEEERMELERKEQENRERRYHERERQIEEHR